MYSVVSLCRNLTNGPYRCKVCSKFTIRIRHRLQSSTSGDQYGVPIVIPICDTRGDILESPGKLVVMD